MHGGALPRTPAGLETLAQLKRRRLAVAALNAVVYVALLVWLASILGAGGWSPLRAAIFIAFAIAAPWSVLGVCNGAIGFCLLHLRRDGQDHVAPYLRFVASDTPPRAATAILMTIRNEDPERVFRRLRAMKASLAATGFDDRFAWFVLSDTDDPNIAAREEAEVAAWRAEACSNANRLHYRRRRENSGYKAGNIHDFCRQWGADFEFIIPLDADSLMDGETILRLVRIGEAHPSIGILQSLVVGAPSESAFARIFQFGMRHGMRSYTMGATWWTADCGPFWGHNALIRVAPFAKFCALPTLPGGQHILSHDQIEAAFMRRAGFEVRVLPLESGSFEENPPNLLEFLRRDLRWCRGNMQYLRLLRAPGLLPVSRFQLIWAISMFLGAPAWTAIVALGALLPAIEDVHAFPVASSKAFYALFLAMYLTPKLLGFADTALTRGGLARYGGSARFLASALIETASSFIIGAVTTLSVTIFLNGLALDRPVEWPSQARDTQALKLGETLALLWPQLAFGAATLALAGAVAPGLALWSLPLTLGYVAAIPFALVTASPKLGAWFRRLTLCATPEEIVEPEILRATRDRCEAGPRCGVA